MNAPITIPDSARLSLRLMDSNDAPLIHELDQDPEVMRYLSNGIPTSWEDVVGYFMPRVNHFTDPARGCGLWEITDKQSGDYLGWILVREYGIETDYHTPDNFELGWRLKRPFWGRGITTEATLAIIAVIRQHVPIRVFSSIADPENLASIGVMKKLGMRYVDERIHHTPKVDMAVAYYEMPAKQ